MRVTKTQDRINPVYEGACGRRVRSCARLLSPLLAGLVARRADAPSAPRRRVSTRRPHRRSTRARRCASATASASPRCAPQADAEAQSARALGRLLGADEPHRTRSQQPELDRLRRALERQLRRGPAAQRLAARARPAPRLGQLRRRVPALSHGRRPRGHAAIALVAEQLAGQGRPRPPASPPGWRRRTPTTAAPCSPPTLVDAKQLASRRHLEEDPPLAPRPNKPRAARQAAALLGPSAATQRRRDRRRPGPLPRQARPATAPRATPSSTPLALTRLAATDSESAAGMLADRWEKALPADLAAWPGPASPGRRAIKLQPEARRPVPARGTASSASRTRDRAARRHCSPGRCVPRCAPTAASRAGSRSCRRSTRCRRPSRRTPPGSTGRRAPCRRWRSDSQDGEACCRPQPRAARPSIAGAAQLLRRSSPPRTSASRRRCRPSRRR